MKKIVLMSFVLVLMSFLVGCSNDSEKGVLKKVKNMINDMDSYYLSGDLTIYSDSNTYNYSVEVYYKTEDYYRVNLINSTNDNEQIILKNDDGVFVISPSLNKSFKFQSNWPLESSQIYLIESLYNDIASSENITFNKLDSGYSFIVDSNYPNNSNLVRQEIVIDNEYNPVSVNVYNDNDEVQMTIMFNNIEINKDIDDSVFNMNNIIDTIDDSDTDVESDNEDESVMSIDDIIYPLYLPTGTVLTDEEKVSTSDGERIILTFEGEKSFILVEETTSPLEEFSIVPTYGEPYMLLESVATLSDNSLTWTSNGIEYYLVSDVMSQIELVEVANSLTVIESDK